jgi:S-adenosylmethionine:tRNA ribosyltransferase-isomerase
MKVSNFDFFLPKELIAKRPLKERNTARLLVLYRDGVIEHRKFTDLPAYLNPRDMLLINNTKVFPARLTGNTEVGDKLDILLVREKENEVWEILSKGGYSGMLRISEELQAILQDGKTARFEYAGDFMDIVWKYGSMPLPPYIKRLPDSLDKETYQTVYAKEEGSIAAPTAGLHFTKNLLEEIISRGIAVRELTLHVGIGTFRPIKCEYVEGHSMEPEYFTIGRNLISEIEMTKAAGKRIVSVGTTTTRAIEGLMSGMYELYEMEIRRNGDAEIMRNVYSRFNCITDTVCQRKNDIIKGSTDIFIYPGYEFKAVSSIVTNFHLPKSTPLMLVSALCGWGKLRRSYEDAIRAKYRFFSYGDAMLIL